MSLNDRYLRKLVVYCFESIQILLTEEFEKRIR
jgi:hypothetical protein